MKHKKKFKALLGQCYLNGTIVDELSNKKKELDGTLKKVEEILGEEHKKVYIELENVLGAVENLIEDKYFDYGADAREVEAYWFLGEEEK
jgi:hypothetical protein